MPRLFRSKKKAVFIFYTSSRSSPSEKDATFVFNMADVHTAQQRSFNMQQIRSTNTKPELLVRKFLHAQGFRYRLHAKELPGKPDLILPKYKTAIFIHGCFWHGHNNCKYFVVPKTRTDWWLNKIHTNQCNDAKAIKTLKKAGWKIIVVWECNLKPAKMQQMLLSLPKKIER